MRSEMEDDEDNDGDKTYQISSKVKYNTTHWGFEKRLGQDQGNILTQSLWINPSRH